MASQLEAYDEANIEELTAAQVKQQSLIATMADGAILLDAEGRIVLANPTAQAAVPLGRPQPGRPGAGGGTAGSAGDRGAQLPWMPCCSVAALTARICAAMSVSLPAPCAS